MLSIECSRNRFTASRNEVLRSGSFFSQYMNHLQNSYSECASRCARIETSKSTLTWTLLMNHIRTFPLPPSDRYKLASSANLVSVGDVLAVTHDSSAVATLLMCVSFTNDPFSLIFKLIIACAEQRDENLSR